MKRGFCVVFCTYSAVLNSFVFWLGLFIDVVNENLKALFGVFGYFSCCGLHFLIRQASWCAATIPVCAQTRSLHKVLVSGNGVSPSHSIWGGFLHLSPGRVLRRTKTTIADPVYDQGRLRWW